MRVTVIGTGYVGLVTGTCLASLGNDVVCLDIDPVKVERLKQGDIPIYEPGLTELVQDVTSRGLLTFTTDEISAAKHGEMQFIAVGTPPAADGSADLRFVFAAAANIARNMADGTVIVDKSTVPVGTAAKVSELVSRVLSEQKKDITFSVVSNPEFLKEGAALDDFNNPDRLVFGSFDEAGFAALRELYAPFIAAGTPVVETTPESSELIKYAANAMLATRISFMNELSQLAELAGADIEDVRLGIGADDRIGAKFLKAGIGYGGSCFPKDVDALIAFGQQYTGQKLPLLSSVAEVNKSQKHVLSKKVLKRFGDVSGMTFAMWGLAFKPDTDDMREAPSIEIINDLVEAGASIRAFDPVAAENASTIITSPHVRFCASADEALTGADALLIVTEWDEFRNLDLSLVAKQIRQPVIFDGRNLYAPAEINAPIEYHSIGRATNG